MTEKTREELAEELAETCAELDAIEAREQTIGAVLHAVLRRLGGSVLLAPGELEDEGQIAFDESDAGILVHVPGESAATA